MFFKLRLGASIARSVGRSNEILDGPGGWGWWVGGFVVVGMRCGWGWGVGGYREEVRVWATIYPLL